MKQVNKLVNHITSSVTLYSDLLKPLAYSPHQQSFTTDMQEKSLQKNVESIGQIALVSADNKILNPFALEIYKVSVKPYLDN